MTRRGRTIPADVDRPTRAELVADAREWRRVLDEEWRRTHKVVGGWTYRTEPRVFGDEEER